MKKSKWLLLAEADELQRVLPGCGAIAPRGKVAVWTYYTQAILLSIHVINP
jgi:hypothetical protein